LMKKIKKKKRAYICRCSEKKTKEKASLKDHYSLVTTMRQ